MNHDKLKLVTPDYDLSAGRIEKLQIKPDETMRPAAFRPDPDNPSHFWAHPLTIEAMKKDIFLLGESPDHHAQNYQCVQCNEVLDRQFWLKCPYCGSRFKL